MKRTWRILMMVGLVLALVASGFAQGRGRGGQGRGWCGQCGGLGGDCWLTRVTSTDPKEKAFVGQVTKLQAELRDEQLALATLQKGGASSTAVDAQKVVLENVRTQFRELMARNSELHQQMVGRYGGGPGMRRVSELSLDEVRSANGFDRRCETVVRRHRRLGGFPMWDSGPARPTIPARVVSGAAS